MPELPEVETIRRDLEKTLLGFTVVDVWTDNPKSLQPNLETVKNAVVGLTITGFRRRGKLLMVDFSNSGKHLLVHLKMTGRLLFRRFGTPQDRWTHVMFVLSKGGNKKWELRFSDSRKFGFIKLATSKDVEQVLSLFGPEPLTDLTFEKLQDIVHGRKRAVKLVLLDQSLIAGVGNIYANEALWLAKIRPGKSAARLTKADVKALFVSLEHVLKESLRNRGTTAGDGLYRDTKGKAGKHQYALKVYDRAGQLCKRCGSVIKKIRLGQRGTFFCPYCQIK